MFKVKKEARRPTHWLAGQGKKLLMLYRWPWPPPPPPPLLRAAPPLLWEAPPEELLYVLPRPLLPVLPDVEERSRTIGGAICNDRGLLYPVLP